RRLADRGLAAGRRQAGRQARARVLRLRARGCVTNPPVRRLNSMFLSTKSTTMVRPEDALPGRDEQMPVPGRHDVLGPPVAPPFPDGLEQAIVGMGCFWGAERVFWNAPGVYTTAVGYAGGYTKNPTYEEVCSGRTGHTEAVLIVFDP